MLIQLCIVTGQPLANLIPILQFKPAIVALAISKDMRQSGKCQAFIDLLLSIGYTDDTIKKHDNVPDAKHDQIWGKACDIRDDLMASFPQSTIQYNITGGNKLMALAFFDVFSGENDTVFYVDTAHEVIEYLNPNNQSEIKFEQLLDVKTYLKAYNKTLRKSACEDEAYQQIIKNRKSLTYWVAKNIANLNDAVGCVNNAAQAALNADGNKIVERLQQIRPNRDVLELFKKAREYSVIQWHEDKPDYVNFPTLDGARYISGGWLEEYAWLVAQDIGLHDVKLGAQITDDYNPKSDLRNELDVVIVHNNKMLIIEAKTSAFGKDFQKDTSIINQLDSLGRNAGGNFCTRLLLSAKELNHSTKQNRQVYVEDRAKSQAIDTLTKARITDLKKYISDWSGKIT